MAYIVCRLVVVYTLDCGLVLWGLIPAYLGIVIMGKHPGPS